MDAKRLKIDSFGEQRDGVERADPVDCEVRIHGQQLNFQVRGTNKALTSTQFQLMHGQTSATIDGKPVTVVATSTTLHGTALDVVAKFIE